MAKTTFFKIKIFFIANIFFFCYAHATIWPKENTSVHYTTVYFQEDFYPGAKNYELVLSKDSLFQSPLDSKNNPRALIPAFWIQQLEWGKVYFWRVRALDESDKTIHVGNVHKFNTPKIETRNFDEVELRVRVNKPASHNGGFIAIDNARSIFTRDGNPVWTLPYIEGLVDEGTDVRDIKMTGNNTITFLAGGTPVEMDFEANVLWKAPGSFVLNQDTIVFHHDLKKDKEGNYFVLGNKWVYRKLLIDLPGDVVKYEDMVKITDSAIFRKTPVGLLLKFNRENKLLWYWDADTYLKDVDLNFKKSMSGFPNFNSHANAFSINKEGTVAYIGFRDLSRIIKLDLKTKKVLESYGEKYPSGDARLLNNLFRSQHDAGITDHGTILILNNNGDRSGGPSSVIEFKESPAKGDSGVVWQLGLGFDGLTNGKSLKGGNVIEMKNSNLLVCSGELNRVFEVTRAKEIVWDAFVYSKRKGDTLWHPFPQYRAGIFDKIVHYHFLAHIDAAKNNASSININYTVYNTGNYADIYTIEVVDENGNRLGEKKTVRIEKNQHIKSDRNIIDNKQDKLSLRVRSQNSGLSESLKIN